VAVFVVSDAGAESYVGERAIAIIVKEKIRRGIAGDVDVWPVIIFEIGSERGEAVVGDVVSED
jgi:hypothetical protein